MFCNSLFLRVRMKKIDKIAAMIMAILEDNTLSQPFYALLNASARLEAESWSVDVWVRNATSTPYDVFYFESMGNRFLQRGRGCSYGVRLALDI